MQQESTAAPSGWRQHLWLALLVLASVAFSLGFACAAPLAAFGAAAAVSLPRRNALLFIGAVWFANQIVGYGFLDYSWTFDSVTWGLVIGLLSVLGTFAAHHAAFRLAGAGRAVAAVVAFLVAFAVYEEGLFVVDALVLGPTENFTFDIVGRIFAINAAAMAGLVLLNGLVAGLPVVAGLRLPARGPAS